MSLNGRSRSPNFKTIPRAYDPKRLVRLSKGTIKTSYKTAHAPRKYLSNKVKEMEGWKTALKNYKQNKISDKEKEITHELESLETPNVQVDQTICIENEVITRLKAQ